MKRFLTILVVAVMAISSVSAQKKEVAALTTEVETLKRQINDAKAREQKLQEENNTIKGEVKALATQVNVLTESFKKLAGESSEAIAAVLATSANPSNDVATSKSAKYQIAGELSCGMIAVREGLLFGFIDSRNEYIIKAQYDAVYDFDRGFACVKKNGKWGVIDTTGKTVIECLYDDLSIWADYSIWRVRNGSHYGLISAVNGAVIAPVKYEDIDDLKYGRARMKINGKRGFFDEKGKVAIPARYSYADSDGFGVDGTARVEGNGRGNHYIDKNGNFVKNY